MVVYQCYLIVIKNKAKKDLERIKNSFYICTRFEGQQRLLLEAKSSLNIGILVGF